MSAIIQLNFILHPSDLFQFSRLFELLVGDGVDELEFVSEVGMIFLEGIITRDVHLNHFHPRLAQTRSKQVNYQKTNKQTKVYVISLGCAIFAKVSKPNDFPSSKW